MGIKRGIQEREYRIKSKSEEIKSCEDRLRFKKNFLKRGKEVFEKSFTY